MTKQAVEENASTVPNDLLTPLAFTQSLTPPRFPPFQTAQHALLLGQNPSDKELSQHFSLVSTPTPTTTATRYYYDRPKIQQLVYTLLQKAHQKQQQTTNNHHPHLRRHPTDAFFRWLGAKLGASSLNYIRDSGWFRTIADTLVAVGVPTMALAAPVQSLRFLQLTHQCRRIPYGTHPSQYLDLYRPPQTPKGLLFFVHGGAWGSGAPWMYRLVAHSFVKDMNMAVAIVGYRTYPDADVNGNVVDLELSLRFLQQHHPGWFTSEFGLCIMGHSSGAHIAMLQVVEHARKLLVHPQQPPLFPLDRTTLVAVSGPLDISSHFDYEAARGVEELSPLKATNGHTRAGFHRNSPAPRLVALHNTHPDRHLDGVLPRILIVHGMEDTTVPFTNAAETAKTIRGCGVTKVQELYLGQTEHQQTVMELMMGGRTAEKIQEWLRDQAKTGKGRRGGEQRTMIVRSKL